MLVFSQFTSLLALLREELETQGVTYCYLDGSMSAKARQAAVDRFQTDESVPVFLISLKASGTVAEKVMALQEAKRALLADVFEASDAAAERLSLGDLRALLE